MFKVVKLKSILICLAAILVTAAIVMALHMLVKNLLRRRKAKRLAAQEG